MANDSDLVQEVRRALGDPNYIRDHSFYLARRLSTIVATEETKRIGQEMVLRALEFRENFGSSASIIEGLARSLGLFPYISPENLDLRDSIAYEFHRPLNFEDEVVFHRPQADVYRLLLDGESVALSAPTSFGKSLIIDAVIATRKYDNIVIIVPTIALIDETRRRLATRFRDEFKVITHPSQAQGTKNIFVLTQERFLQFESIPVDFFVIDEFYKLSPGRDDDDRCWLLNQAFYKLAKTGKQFYMLGPGILDLSRDLRDKVKFSFIKESYHTVVSEVTRVPTGENRFQRLLSICSSLTEPTMIFCSSPASASKVAKELIRNKIGIQSPWLNDATRWISQHYRQEWHFPIALRNGIGVHHGRIPRALSQYIVRQFNEERLRFLVCTSTLIEGVNTKAKNIIVFDNKIAQKEIDLFTFNNIQGRAGRMFQHFVGRVFIFYDPPQSDLPLVDVPAFSQDAPPTLLMQIDENDLTEKSQSKLFRYKNQDLLAYETLRANVGVDPDAQLALAETISSNLREFHPLLNWSYYPDTNQLRTICKLIWDHFRGLELGNRSVWTPAQLSFLVSMLSARRTTRELIQSQIEFLRGRSAEVDIDDVVQRILDFLRLWANHHFPRLLRALDRIQRDIFTSNGLSAGNYETFATSVENFFLDPTTVALDEYGIPIELARKIESRLNPEGSIDTALTRLKSLDPTQLGLSRFEIELIKDTQAYL